MNRRTTALIWLGGAIAVVAALASACGGSDDDDDEANGGDATTAPTAAATAPATSGDAVRAVEGEGDPRTAWTFEPKQIDVTHGATVTFTNTGSEVHTATADDGSFDTGTLNPGDGKAVMFHEAGTFAYHCTLHPWMQGQVVVTGG
jgi:plastocyanin